MKFQVEKNALYSGLTIPQKVTDGNPSLNPILENVFISADEQGVVSVSATDGFTSVISRFNAEVEVPGTTTVNGKTLFRLVSTLSGSEVSLEKKDNQLFIKNRRSEFELNAARDEDFPDIVFPSDDVFKSFEPVVMSELIEKTIYSVSVDDTKPHLMGIFFFCDNKIARSVSTDGHRLSLSEFAYEGEFSIPSGIIIPKKGASEIKQLADSGLSSMGLAYLTDRKLFAAKMGGTVLTVKTVDSKYPPYEAVIPKYDSNRIVIPLEPFTTALKRINVLSEQKSESGVIFSLSPDKLEMYGTDTLKGKSREELEVGYEGERVQVAFNMKFLDQILTKIDGSEFFMFLGGSKDAALIKPVDNTSFLAVLMPLRITDN